MARLLGMYRCYQLRKFCTKQSIKAPIRNHEFGVPSSSNLVLQNYMKSSAMKEVSSLSSSSLLLESKQLIFNIYNDISSLSIFSKLFYSSFLLLILFGDYLDRKLIEYENPLGIYSFLTDSPEDSLMQICQTGDLMVFQRPLFSFNPINILRTSLRQFACSGAYDHCAIIINNKYDSNLPFIVEIDQNYRNKLKITPFDKRILISRESSIFIRQLQKAQISNDNVEKLSDWIEYKVNNNINNIDNIKEIDNFINSLNYKRDSLLNIIMILLFNGDNTIKLRSSIKDLTRKIKQNEYELKTQIAMGPKQVLPSSISSKHYQHQRYGRIRDNLTLIKEIKQYKLQRILKRDNLKKRKLKIRESMKINSSAFIAEFWRYLNILDKENGAKPSEIRPQHFADSKLEIPLINNTRLGHIQFVKTVNESEKINDSERRFRNSKLSLVHDK